MYHVFCSKCGRVCFGNPYIEEKCDVCKSVMKHVPEKYISENEILTDKQCYKRVNEPNGLYDELVKNSPEFDQYLFDHRDEILAKQFADFNAKMEHGKTILEEQSNIPKCPTCQSTNIRKMSGLESGASIAMWGIFSKKINKSFKCNNCGYTW